MNESDSEATDGYLSDTGSCLGGTTIAEQMRQREKNKEIDDISEHSSDDYETESDEEINTNVKNTEKRLKKRVKDPDAIRKKKSKEGQPKDKDKKKKEPTKAEPSKDVNLKTRKDPDLKTAKEQPKQKDKSKT